MKDVEPFRTALAALGTRPSRRHVVRVLTGLGIAGFTTPDDVHAGRRKKRKHKHEKPTSPPPPLDCPGGCGNETCCFGSCVNLASSSANCGACGHTCATNLCVNGACDCQFLATNCPATCGCAARKVGGSVCSGGEGDSVSCTIDVDCPVGTACLVTDFCSRPCLL